MSRKLLLGGILLLTIVVIAITHKAKPTIIPVINQNLPTLTTDSYISCGCGCCSFDKPLDQIAKTECLYKSKGESIQDKINNDKQLSQNFCATVGCSFPIKYIYCD